jgi:glycosyltransferase involved in cell wall biosynthesis
VVKTPRLPRTHLRTLYHLATAVCCPSRYEGFGLPAAQGMACGAPVLASDIPAHREVLGDAADLLSPDSPGAWTDAILRMVQDPARRDRLARAGRQRAERYRWTQVAEQYRRLYGEVAGGQVAGA